jgi:N-acetylneuraminic acid mutarotase
MLKLGFLLITVGALGIWSAAQELKWHEMAQLPRPVAGYMAAASHGKLLIIGGSYWENKEKHWSDLVQVFDPRTNTWTTDGTLPEARSDAAAAALNDDIYCFGGGRGNDVRTDALVLHNGKWSSLPSGALPEPRLYSTATTLDGYIYLLGGMSTAGNYKSISNAFWRWKPTAKRWEVLAALPGPGRISHAMAVINRDIYVFGGATTGPQDVENLKDVYRYEVSSNHWTRLPDLPIANRAWWSVGLGTRALLVGGYTNDFAREVYVYESQQLSSRGTLPHAVADAKFFRIGNAVVGAGGEAGPGIRSQWTFLSQLPKEWVNQH